MGLDEAHEMLINKDCKIAVVRPTKEFVSRMAFHLGQGVMHNFQNQLTPEAPSISNKDKSPILLEKIKENIEVSTEKKQTSSF